MATYYIQTIELKLKISHQSAVEWRTCEDSVKCKQNLGLKRNSQDPRLFSKVLVEQRPQPDAILPL